MIRITNTKIEGFSVVWKTMRGWSLLFDRPEKGEACAQTEHFFEGLTSSIGTTERYFMLHQYGLCALPPKSHHVTVLDGVNDDILHLIEPSYQPVFAEYLDGLGHTVVLPEPFRGLVARSPLLRKRDWNIALSYETLSLWERSQALTLQLSPADGASADRLAALAEARRALGADLDALLHARLPQKVFVPHITMGYFANAEVMDAAKNRLEEWSAYVSRALEGRTLVFDSVSVYGFRDMTCFFK